MTHNTPPATAYFNPNRFGFTCRHDIFPGCDESARAYDPRPAKRESFAGALLAAFGFAALACALGFAVAAL